LRGWSDVRAQEGSPAAVSPGGAGAGGGMVFDHQDEYPSQWKAIESISAKLSINHETLRQWVRRVETDAGQRPGLTTDERARMRELEREVKELRRANEILKAAAHFFGAELDRQSPK
jgi:transposase